MGLARIPIGELTLTDKMSKRLPKLTGKLANNPNLNAGGVVGHDGSNAGRKPDWFKEKCDQALFEANADQFLKDTIAGNYDTKGARHVDKIKAIEVLKESSHLQNSIANIKFVFDFVQKITNTINAVLSDSCPHCHKPLPFRSQTIQQLEVLASEENGKAVAA